MVMAVREQLIAELDYLTDEQIKLLLHQAQAMHPATSAEDNPLVGFISGPTNFAERTEDILEAEFGLKKSDHEP